MQQQHDPLYEHQQVAAHLQALGLVFAVQTGLGDLQVPVAQLVPDEAVEQPGHVVEVVALVQAGDLLGHRRQPAEDPAVGHGGQLHLGLGVRMRAVQHEARGVPDLVGEVAPHLDALSS